MGENERSREDGPAVEECKRLLSQLQKKCPSMYEGLLAGLAPLPTAPLVDCLRFMRDLVSHAPEGWHESDLNLEDQSERRQRANAHLIKRLERRNLFCSFRASYVIARISLLRESAAQNQGAIAGAYAFAARRVTFLVGSFLRTEAAKTGIRIVPSPPPSVPSPRTCIIPPPQRLAKVLLFKRPS